MQSIVAQPSRATAFRPHHSRARRQASRVHDGHGHYRHGGMYLESTGPAGMTGLNGSWPGRTIVDVDHDGMSEVLRAAYVYNGQTGAFNGGAARAPQTTAYVVGLLRISLECFRWCSSAARTTTVGLSPGCSAPRQAERVDRDLAPDISGPKSQFRPQHAVL